MTRTSKNANFSSCSSSIVKFMFESTLLVWMITNVSSTNRFHNLGDELNKEIDFCLTYSITKFAITTERGDPIGTPNIRFYPEL